LFSTKRTSFIQYGLIICSKIHKNRISLLGIKGYVEGSLFYFLQFNSVRSRTIVFVNEHYIGWFNKVFDFKSGFPKMICFDLQKLN